MMEMKGGKLNSEGPCTSMRRRSYMKYIYGAGTRT